jgi:hypothetical protein
MKPIIVGGAKLPGNARMICAAPRNFAHAIAPQDLDAWATRRYVVPRVDAAVARCPPYRSLLPGSIALPAPQVVVSR